MDNIKKYYSHLLFEAVVETDTLDGTAPSGEAKAPTNLEIFAAYFFNSISSIGPQLDDLINKSIKEAESENGIKGARGFAGIAGAEWIVLRRSIFYATMMYILLRFVNKTGAEGMKAAVNARIAEKSDAKAKNLSGKKSKEQRDKEKELTGKNSKERMDKEKEFKAKAKLNEDIQYIESLAAIGGLLKTIVQRVPAPGVNKNGTYRYFVKDVKTMLSIILGVKSGIRYCKSPVGSGANHVERFYDEANLNQTYATTLKYIRNMSVGKAPNDKWGALSPEILQKTLEGSAFKLSYGDISKTVVEMSKQMFLLAYANEDININQAHEKVQNALSKVTGIQARGTVSNKISQDTLK